MASPEAAAILRELQQQRDNGVRAVPTAPSDFPIDFGIHAHRYVTPMGNDQRAVAPALTPLTKSAGSPDRPGTACRPWGCAFGHFWRCAPFFFHERLVLTIPIPIPSPTPRPVSYKILSLPTIFRLSTTVFPASSAAATTIVVYSNFSTTSPRHTTVTCPH